MLLIVWFLDYLRRMLLKEKGDLRTLGRYQQAYNYHSGMMALKAYCKTSQSSCFASSHATVSRWMNLQDWIQ